MRAISSLIALLLLLGSARAEVALPVPAYSWVDSTGAAKSSKELLGRPVLIFFADSPRDWTFRSQVGQLQKIYERLANDKVVCVAVFSREPGVIRSNIPFVSVSNGSALLESFHFEKGFGIAFIGRDGNVDCTSKHVIPAYRILDLVNNSFVNQQNLRRQ